MTTASDLTRTRPVSARLPEVLAVHVERVQARLGLRHFSDALIYVLDRGLDAIAQEHAKPDRLEAMMARVDHFAVTTVAILNVVHDLDPEAVAETRETVLEALAPRARDGHPTARGFRPRKADGEVRS